MRDAFTTKTSPGTVPQRGGIAPPPTAPAAHPETTRIPLGQHDILLVRDHGFQYSPAVERYANALDAARFRVLAFGWDREAKLTRLEQRPHFDIQRARFFRAPSRSRKVILGLLLWQLRVFWRALFAREQLIHACDFHSGPACRLATLINRKPFIYDMRDPISVTFDLGRGLNRVLDRLERFFTDISDRVIIPGENRMKYVGARARGTRTLVLHNAPTDRPDLLSVARRPPPQRFTPEDPLRINACGHIHAGRGILELLELAARCDSVRLDVIGDPRNDELLARILATPRVHYLEPVPLARSQELMADAHLVASLYDPASEINRVACSNKTYEAMMLARPMLTNEGINIGELVHRERIGVVVTFGSVDSLMSAIRPLLSNPAPLQSMGERARRLFEREYGWQKQSADYVGLVNTLVGGSDWKEGA